ncbi:hypothetical protein E2562_030454 [Oryza meyeriana var. granulata]|uniref:Uncharacterized protein n=1 Tax=Oryza meyeriana var. granulata TaxID=110450 RepID=A0A6G1BPL3_9ORYZ|nr:hypothetical protein E2562_030454 [Oryza meyeriana var. granulata]
MPPRATGTPSLTTTVWIPSSFQLVEASVIGVPHHNIVLVAPRHRSWSWIADFDATAPGEAPSNRPPLSCSMSLPI